MDLEAVAAISRLKYAYLRALDTKCWDEFADTLLPEATANYGEHLAFESRDALVEFMKSNLGPQTITEHHCGHPEIDVDGDSATGRWYLSDIVLIPEHDMVLRGAAFYSDRYVRGPGGRWRIAHTGYERTYEAVMSLADIPSFRLTSNRWAADTEPGKGDS
nr:nuclear transport factor 2 family protein [Rhodococcus wratislaviensis]GLK34193.1 bile-acid 7-alpha-dehydratase [Rhodococcus wratislaviensis]